MDKKTRFLEIQSLLEQYLNEYKNCFPTTIWQKVSPDIPYLILIVSSVVVIRLLGVGITGLVVMILFNLPYIWMSKSDWPKNWKKRKDYRNNRKAILDKINAIDTSEFEQYPDVKQYLENYHSELAAEIHRKESIVKSHIIIRIIVAALIVAGALLIYNTETRIKLFNPEIVKPQIQNVFTE